MSQDFYELKDGRKVPNIPTFLDLDVYKNAEDKEAVVKNYLGGVATACYEMNPDHEEATAQFRSVVSALYEKGALKEKPQEAQKESGVWGTIKAFGRDLREIPSALLDGTKDTYYDIRMGNNAIQGDLEELESLYQSRGRSLASEGETVVGRAAIGAAKAAPFMATSVASGVAGGAVGSFAGPIGTTLGAGTAAFLSSYQQGAGDMYSRLRDEDVSPEDALGISLIAAAPYAGVEFIQLKKIPGVSHLAEKYLSKPFQSYLVKKLSDKVFSSKVARALGEYGGNIIAQSAEEGVQEGIMDVGVQYGVNGGFKGYDISQTAKAAVEGFKDSVGTFSIIQAPTLRKAFKSNNKESSKKDLKIDISSLDTVIEEQKGLKVNSDTGKVEGLISPEVDEGKTQANAWQSGLDADGDIQISGSYDLVEADAISSDPELDSDATTIDIAKNLDASRLQDSSSIDAGAPVLDEEGNVVAGNKRLSAVAQAYKSSPEQAKIYKESVINAAISLGMDPEKAKTLKNPVLIRKASAGSLAQAQEQIQAKQVAQWQANQAELNTQREAQAQGLDSMQGEQVAQEEAQGDSLVPQQVPVQEAQAQGLDPMQAQQVPVQGEQEAQEAQALDALDNEFAQLHQRYLEGDQAAAQEALDILDTVAQYKGVSTESVNDIFATDTKGNLLRPSQRFNTEEVHYDKMPQGEAFDSTQREVMPESKSQDASKLNLNKEEAEVRTKHINTPMYMKAPNGEPTNLTEKQWLEVRTPGFMDKHGNWALSGILEKFKNSKDANIAGTELTDVSAKGAKTYIKTLIKNRIAQIGKATWINKDTLQEIEITGKGTANEIASHHSKDEDHLKGVVAIPQLIENSIFLRSKKNEDTKAHYDISSFDYYLCGLNIGGTPYTAKIVIANRGNGTRYYDQNLSKIEKGQLLSTLLAFRTQGVGVTLTNNIDKRLLSLLQEKSEIILDKNGEPDLNAKANADFSKNKKLDKSKDSSENSQASQRSTSSSAPVKNFALPEVVRMVEKITKKLPVVEIFKNKALRGYFDPKTKKIAVGSHVAEILTNEELSQIRQKAIEDLYAIESRLSPKPLTISNFINKLKTDANLKRELAHRQKMMAQELRRKVATVRTSAGAQVFAHELGHFVDAMPSGSELSGNILGKLKGLKGFLEKSLKDDKGKTHKNAEIRKELINLSLWWRGINKKFSELDKDYADYLSSANELYADAFSVFVNDIGAFESRAPKAFAAFREFFGSHKEAMQAYKEIQETLVLGEDARVAKNRQAVRDSYAPENQTKGDVQVENKWWNAWDYLTSRFIDQFQPIYRRIKQNVEKLGADYYDEAMDKLKSYNLRGTHHQAYVKTLKYKVFKALKKLNIDSVTFDEYITYNHIIQNRAGIFNTMGTDAKEAAENLKNMEKTLGSDAMEAMKKAQEQWWALRKELVIDPLKEAGVLDDNLIALIESRPNYAPFLKLVKEGKAETAAQELVKKYCNRANSNVSAAIHAQVGFLGEIRSPSDSLLFKDLALMDFVSRNEATKTIVDVLQKTTPEVCIEAIVDKKETKHINNENIGTVVFMDKGKLKAYYVPKDIADSLKGSADLKKLGKVASVITNFQKSVFTSKNIGFILSAGLKDVTASYRRTPTSGATDLRNVFPPAGYIRWLYRTVKNIPSAFKSLYSENSDFDYMLKDKKVISSMQSLGAGGARYLDGFSDMLAYKRELGMPTTGQGNALLAKKAWNFLCALGKPLKLVEGAAQIMERASKITADQELAKNTKLSEAAKRNAVRMHGGSPDFSAHGSWAKALDIVFPFYNAAVQGMTTELDAARLDKWYWWRTANAVLGVNALRWGASGLLGKGFSAALAAIAGAEDEDELKEMEASIPHYDKANYLCIITGWEDKAQRKVSYLRIPLEETTRLFSGLFYGATTDASVSNALSFTSAQVPSTNPLWTEFTKWSAFFAGENPYDSFRRRNVLDDVTYNIGGAEALTAMAKHSWNALGGTMLHTFRDESIRDSTPTTTEKILSLPVVSSVVGRLYKVSNRGLSDSARKYGIEYSESIAKDKQLQERLAIKLSKQEPLNEQERKALIATFSSKAEMTAFKSKVQRGMKSKSMYYYNALSALSTKNHRRYAVKQMLDNGEISKEEANKMWINFNLHK